MSTERKKAAIVAFVQGQERIRRAVREDMDAIIKSAPIEILGDADALEEWMTEALDAVLAKHIVTEDQRVRPEVARLIRQYVRDMTAEE